MASGQLTRCGQRVSAQELHRLCGSGSVVDQIYLAMLGTLPMVPIGHPRSPIFMWTVIPSDYMGNQKAKTLIYNYC
jgi:hypothetical protein